MGINLNGTLNIATRSLQTSQTALGTISHNLANVNTEGFSRQTVQLGSNNIAGFGNGASVTNIGRSIDNLLLKRISAQTSAHEFNVEKQKIYNSIETVIGSGETSIENRITGLFAELNTLSNNTDSSAQKLNVVKNATLLADSLRNTMTSLSSLQTDIDTDINADIDSINTILSDINTLNIEISSVENQGLSANDLRDSRQILVNDLAKGIGLNVREDTEGKLVITTENGRSLIFSGGYSQLEREAGSGSFQDIAMRTVQTDGTLSSSVLVIDTSTLTSGSLKAQVDMRDTAIDDIKSELNEMAETLILEFNKIHSRGSAVPPQQTLTSTLRTPITDATTDLYTEVGSQLQDNTFHISIVSKVDGSVISSTSATGAGGPITLPGAGPFSLTDLKTLVDGNADVGGVVTVNLLTDSSGDPYVEFDAGAGRAVVLSNVSGDFLGELQMNNFFTGADASDINLRSDIAASPELMATARMRSDGGLSFLDNQNVLALAELGSATQSFDAAGRLAAQTETFTNYGIKIVAAVAVDLNDVENRITFSEAVLADMEDRNSGISGVNMDEELANLILFQNSFQASARIIQTVQQMFEDLIRIV